MLARNWGDVGAQPDRCQRSRLCWESRKGGVADRSRGRAGCSTSLSSPAYGEWTKSWLFTPGCVTLESYTISLCLSFLFCETVVIIVARRIVVSIQSVKKHNTLRMTSECSTNVGTPSSPGDLCGPSGSGLQAFVMASWGDVDYFACCAIEDLPPKGLILLCGVAAGGRGTGGALSGTWHPGALPDGAAWSPKGEPLGTPYGLGISLGAPDGTWW